MEEKSRTEEVHDDKWTVKLSPKKAFTSSGGLGQTSVRFVMARALENSVCANAEAGTV